MGLYLIVTIGNILESYFLTQVWIHCQKFTHDLVIVFRTTIYHESHIIVQYSMFVFICFGICFLSVGGIAASSPKRYRCFILVS